MDTQEIESKLPKQDLARVKQCGTEMHEATNGNISVSTVERNALGVRSPALLEQEQEIRAQR